MPSNAAWGVRSLLSGDGASRGKPPDNKGRGASALLPRGRALCQHLRCKAGCVGDAADSCCCQLPQVGRRWPGHYPPSPGAGAWPTNAPADLSWRGCAQPPAHRLLCRVCRLPHCSGPSTCFPHSLHPLVPGTRARTSGTTWHRALHEKGTSLFEQTPVMRPSGMTHYKRRCASSRYETWQENRAHASLSAAEWAQMYSTENPCPQHKKWCVRVVDDICSLQRGSAQDAALRLLAQPQCSSGPCTRTCCCKSATVGVAALHAKSAAAALLHRAQRAD